MKKEKILRLAENKRIVTIQRARFHTGQVRERALYFGEWAGYFCFLSFWLFASVKFYSDNRK